MLPNLVVPKFYNLAKKSVLVLLHLLKLKIHHGVYVKIIMIHYHLLNKNKKLTVDLYKIFLDPWLMIVYNGEVIKVTSLSHFSSLITSNPVSINFYHLF